MTAAAQSGEPAAVFVVKGGDPALVDRGVEQLLAELTSTEGPLGARRTRTRPA